MLEVIYNNREIDNIDNRTKEIIIINDTILISPYNLKNRIKDLDPKWGVTHSRGVQTPIKVINKLCSRSWSKSLEDYSKGKWDGNRKKEVDGFNVVLRHGGKRFSSKWISENWWKWSLERICFRRMSSRVIWPWWENLSLDLLPMKEGNKVEQKACGTIERLTT